MTMNMEEILKTFPNQATIDNFCDYEHYFEQLSFYDIDPFVYHIDYKKLDNVYELFSGLTRMLFRTPLLTYINIIINMIQTDTLSPTVLMEYQLQWCVVLGLLVLVFAILILGALMTILKTIFAAGKPRDCYQKINPANDYIVNFVGGLMLISALVVLFSSLVGYLGNNLYSNIKKDYGDFAKNAKDYIDKYVQNITDDMNTITNDEFDYLTRKLEEHLINYHYAAATKVHRAEERPAKILDAIADDMERDTDDMLANVMKIKELVGMAWRTSEPFVVSMSKCTNGLDTYCGKNDNCAVDPNQPDKYILDPDNVRPVTISQYNDYTTKSLDTLAARLNRIKTIDIPGFTREKSKLLELTVDELMTHNKPMRTGLSKTLTGLKDWLKRSVAKANLVKNGWKVTLASILPSKQREYEAASTLDLIIKYENYVSSIMFSMSLLLAVFCCGLYMLGMCTRVKGVLPTERSDSSEFVAKGFSYTLGIMFLLNLVSMVLAITHYVPSTILSKMCQEINEENADINPFQIWDTNMLQSHSILSSAIGDTASNVTFYDFLQDCKENKSLYSALNLKNVWNLEKDFSIKQFLDYSRYTVNSGLGGSSRSDTHWGTTYYSEDELNKIYQAGNETKESNTNSLVDIIPLISNRGIIRVNRTDIDNFRSALDTAVINAGISNKPKILECTTTLNSWLAVNTTMKETNDEIIRIIQTTMQKLDGIRKMINDTKILNTEIFKRSSSTYMITMVEAQSEMDKEVACYGQIAGHQYSYILGRCRPLYDTYIAVNNFVCGRAGKTMGILTLAFLMNFIIVMLFSVSIMLLIPHFQKMTRLHPEDKLKIEREQIAKANPQPEQDDSTI